MYHVCMKIINYIHSESTREGSIIGVVLFRTSMST